MKEKRVQAESINRMIDNIEGDLEELSSGLGTKVKLDVDS